MAPWEVALADGYLVSDDRDRLDLATVHRYIAEESYWGRGRSLAAMQRAVAHSICLGLYAPGGAQAGFARAFSDRAVRAHIADVFVLPVHRGRGLGRGLVGALLDHPELACVGTWSLSTHDRHGLYAGFGFTLHPEPHTQMVMHRPRNG